LHKLLEKEKIELEVFWNEFANILIDIDDEVEEEFYFWNKGYVVFTSGIGLKKIYPIKLHNVHYQSNVRSYFYI
jgi:hypothetical protein